MNSDRSATTAIAEPRAALRTWGICGLMLLATMLNYMDRQALSQQATEISRELKLSNEDYGRHRGGLRPGVRRGRDRHGADRRPDQSALALPGGLAGLVGRRVRDRLGHQLPRAARLPGAAGVLRGRALACALVTAQRLLSRRDRPLGNSILQSGASLGAIATPIVVLAPDHGRAGSWRLPFRVIGAIGVVWVVAWLAVVRSRDLDLEPTRPCPSSAPENDRARGPARPADPPSPIPRAGADVHPPVPGPGGRRDRHQPLLAVLPGLDAQDAPRAISVQPEPGPVLLDRLLPGRRRRLPLDRVPGQVAGGPGLLGPRSADDDLPGLLAPDRPEHAGRRSCPPRGCSWPRCW